jgi:hypothetical protein
MTGPLSFFFFCEEVFPLRPTLGVRMRATSSEYSDSWLQTLFPPSPLIQRDWHPETRIQIQQRNCPRFSRGSSFRRALSEGCWPATLLALCSRRLNSQRTDVISECWGGGWQEVFFPLYDSKRRALRTRKTNHDVTWKDKRYCGSFPSAPDFFQKRI